MAPKRRLFEPVKRNEYMQGPGGTTLTGFELQPPPEKSQAQGEMDSLTALAKEPDDVLRISKIARLLQQDREGISEEGFKAITNAMREKIASRQMQTGQAGPGAIEQAAGFADIRNVLNAPSQGFEKLSTPLSPEDRAYLESPDATPYEQFTGGIVDMLAPKDADLVQPGMDTAVQSLKKGAFGTAALMGSAVPDLASAGISMAGAGIANQAFGNPGGASAMDQARGLLTPMQTAGEVISSTPAMAVSAMGGDPASLPGILARSEAYLANLGGRVYENPIEPVVGGMMAIGGGLAGKRRLFDRPAPAAQAAPVAQLSQPGVGAPPLRPDLAADGWQMNERMMQQGDMQLLRPQQQPAAQVVQPGDAVPPQVRRDAPRTPSGQDWDTQRPPNATPEMKPLGAPPEESIPVESMTPEQRLQRLERLVGKEKAPGLLEQPAEKAPATDAAAPADAEVPDISDVDAMIERFKQAETEFKETQVAPGKKRLSIKTSDGSPGVVRPTRRLGGGGRRRGSLTIPSMRDIVDQARTIASDIAGFAKHVITRNSPRKAPAPGQAGGPGRGIPFRVEALNETLRPVDAPSNWAQAKFEHIAHPSAKGSWYERAGFVDLGIQGDRLWNTIDMDSKRFLYGDEAGKTWLREELQKAGPDLNDALVATMEGKTLTSEQASAVAKHQALFDQIAGPAKQFYRYVDQTGMFRSLGEHYTSYDWGAFGDVNRVMQKDGGRTSAKGTVAADRARQTVDAPLRNFADALEDYRRGVMTKVVKGQMLEQIKRLKENALKAPVTAEATNQIEMMADAYANQVVFGMPDALDRWVQQYKAGDLIRNHPKPGEKFFSDDTWLFNGEVEVVEPAYESPTKGQTYRVKIDGKDWPVAFSGAELAALKSGKNFPSAKIVSTWVNRINKLASIDSIAGNLRTLWRQATGGQARQLAETELKDYAHGHGKGLQYWTGTLPESDIRMLKESGILEGETSLQGWDLGSSLIGKVAFGNVYIPDTQAKVAAWFSEWNRLGRENPGMSREARMDASTKFALRVSDLNLAMVQAPSGNAPLVALFGLFNKSRLRELRHIANMNASQKTRYVGAQAAMWTGLSMLAGLNGKEMRSILWTLIPSGELLANYFGDKSRPDSFIGAAGIDVILGRLGRLLQVADDATDDVADGRVSSSGIDWGPKVSDNADEMDRRWRKFPLMPSSMYRTGSDLVRATLGDEKSSANARASLVTAPQRGYRTEYQKERAKERARESREESGSHSSGGRRGKRKKRLFH